MKGVMKEKCECCRRVNEEVYWTHFHTMHFCQFLTRDFRSRLMIPKKFADKKKDELNEKLVIKGPSGVTWEVNLVRMNDILYFGDGWEEFVNDHSLQQNDILMFKYNGNSEFDVLILDRRSLCEKEDSYFVTKCEHKKKPQETEVTENLVPYALIDDDDKRGIGPQEIVVAVRSVKPRLEDELSLVPKKGTNYSSMNCVSNGRSISEAEKRAVFQKASKELDDDSFIVIMRPTHVSRKFYLNVPVEWLTKHVSHQQTQDVILRTTEKSWEAKLSFDGRGRGGLAKGWREFALGNSLEEYDVCVFKLASSLNAKLKSVTTLDVNIFRVVPDAIPLSLPGPSHRLLSEIAPSP